MRFMRSLNSNFLKFKDQVAKKLESSDDEALQSCRELLSSRRDVQIKALEEELKQMEASYEEITVWFHMEERE